EWLALQQQRPQEVFNAVRAMGTNALPFLVKQVEYDIPSWRINLLRVHSRLPTWMRSEWIVKQVFPIELRKRSGQAIFGFYALGPESSAAIPELGRFLCEDPGKYRPADSLGNAASALVTIGGRDALPPLLAAMTNRATPE